MMYDRPLTKREEGGQAEKHTRIFSLCFCFFLLTIANTCGSSDFYLKPIITATPLKLRFYRVCGL